MREERELPEGWVIAPLGDLATFEMGQAPPGAASNFSGDGEVFVKAGEFGERHPVVREWTTKPLKYATDKDVLICVVGATAGKLNLGIDCAIGRSVAAIRPSVALDQLALYFQLLISVLSLRASSTGSAQGVISKKMLAEIPIALPPLNEQRRIAAKLDTTLAAVEACRQRLDGVAAILKRFRQAVLAAATSGELTREWREERGLEVDGMKPKTIQEIATQIFDGPFGSHLKTDDYTSEGFRVVRLENLQHLRFLEEKRTFISPAKFATLERHVLLENDILFSSFVDEEVRTCLLPLGLSSKSINKADCFCVRVDQSACIPSFVVAVLSCRTIFDALDGLVHGATRPRINLKQLKSLTIKVPPLDEQTEIVRRLEDLFTLADQLEANLSAAREIVERLTPALLAKAFRGELVPQDPNDEPASVLVERIRAARQAEAAADKPSRRGRGKAAAHPEKTPLPAAPVPPDHLAQLLQECGALSERALLAASELKPVQFRRQLALEVERGNIRAELDGGTRGVSICRIPGAILIPTEFAE